MSKSKDKKKEKELVCECGTKKSRGYSNYYDTPDGCDVGTKIMVASRYGILAGLILSTYDVLMYSHAVGISKIISRYMVHTIPLGLMGAVFAAVANGAQLTRGKDDKLNYFLGGAACSPILASWLGSKHAVLLGALFLGNVAMVKKEAIEKGYSFIPDVKQYMSTCRSWRYDWTLSHDPRDDQPANECLDEPEYLP